MAHSYFGSPYAAVALAAAAGVALLALLSDRKRNMSVIWGLMSANVDERLRQTKLELLQAPPLRGSVLEVGPGIGSSLAYLTPGAGGVTRLVLAEPNVHMHARLGAAAAAAGFSSGGVQLLAAPAAALPLPDACMDAAISCLVLCSVPDQAAALREVQRVLKPRGRLLFIEHVVPPADRPVARAQARALTASGVWPWVGDGCHLTRDTGAAIRAVGGWRSVQLQEVFLPYGLLPAASRHVVGVAVKA